MCRGTNIPPTSPLVIQNQVLKVQNDTKSMCDEIKIASFKLSEPQILNNFNKAECFSLIFASLLCRAPSLCLACLHGAYVLVKHLLMPFQRSPPPGSPPWYISSHRVILIPPYLLPTPQLLKQVVIHLVQPKFPHVLFVSLSFPPGREALQPGRVYVLFTAIPRPAHRAWYGAGAVSQ